MRTRRDLLIAGCLALFGTACTPRRVSTRWVSDNLPAVPHTHFLILGVANSERIRRAYEQGFVTALQERGLSAQASYRLTSASPPLKAAALRQVIARAQATAILVTHLLGDSDSDDNTAASTGAAADLVADRQLFPYYTRVAGYVKRPGYYAQLTALHLETNLYAAETATLLWSGRSLALDPASEDTTMSELIAATLDRMQRDGALAFPVPAPT